VDLIDRIDEVTALVESARAMPMSANCIVSRTDVLELLDDLRMALPAEVRRARAVLEEREEVLVAGREEADRLVAEGLAQRERLVSQAEVTVAAHAEADRIRTEAAQDAERLRREVEDFCAARLDGFEQVLRRTLQTVERGRARLDGRTDDVAVSMAEVLPDRQAAAAGR
jgi:cell division septum initiation protein DivIVA